MSRRYRITHRTAYTYDDDVENSYGRAYLIPRDNERQTCVRAAVRVDPEPAEQREHVDWFGNRSTYFSVTTPHRALTVLAESVVTIDDPDPPPPAPGWSQVRDLLAADPLRSGLVPARLSSAGLVPAGLVPGGLVPGDEVAVARLLDARGFALPSPRLPSLAAVATYARPSFRPGRPVDEAAVDLIERIHRDFRYVSGSTTVGSSVAELLDRGTGVCQDFAHLAVAGLRSVGLAARYVSGYLETVPPPGRERLVGADASHAWAAVFTGTGWLHVDPTNDRAVDASYIEVAHGRDYADVPPLKGVIFSDATESVMTVAVDVVRDDSDATARTGLPVVHLGRPVTTEDVRARVDDR